MSDESDDDAPKGPLRHTSRIRCLSTDSSSDSDSVNRINFNNRFHMRKKRRILSDDGDDSDSGSPVIRPRGRRNIPHISSDSDEDSDTLDSITTKRMRHPLNVFHSDDDVGESSNSVSCQGWVTDQENKENKEASIASSDSGDDQSDSCPICFLPIRNQELGSPDTCEHLFCLKCIMEWSKNKITCPIDRQEYKSVLVRERNNMDVLKRIPVEAPVTPQSSQDELTFCEICGLGDREDRLLLCDGCDLGFHLECLTPPLQEVPWGSWFCNVCTDAARLERDLDVMEIHRLLDGQTMRLSQEVSRPSRNTTTRLIPRTRLTERVRNSIRNNREEQPSSSTQTAAAASTRRRTKRKRRYRPKRSRKFRVTHRLDEDTGEIISTVHQPRARRRKTCRKRVKKDRCASSGHRRPTNSNSNRGRQVGVSTTLDLFGQREQLYDFDASDGDDVPDFGGPNYMVRRRPTSDHVAAFRSVSRRKAIVVSPPSLVTSSTDLLGDILESQTKLFARGGTGNAAKKTAAGNEENRGNQNCYPNDNSSARRDDRSGYGDNFGPSSTSESYVFPATAAAGNGDDMDADLPQDYTRGTLSASYERDDFERKDDDSDIDIYSDIEDSVSTSRVVEEPIGRNENLSIALPNLGSDNDNDSDNDMVIDTERVEVPTQEEKKEEDRDLETAVSSSEDTVHKTAPSEQPHSTTEKEDDDDDDGDEDDDDDAGSEDGCPNFSIYSKESITMAKNTDITLENDQVDVISSTPTEEGANETPYDPERPYDAESSQSGEAYDPEKVFDTPEETEIEEPKEPLKISNPNVLYSDSEDEEVVKISKTSFGIGDIRTLTEDVSEEERSYTPCMDEKGKGPDGLDTEMISDDEKNDFDESHEHKASSEGDALEINAKESEMDLIRPEDFEEGEIVDKNKKKEKEKEATAEPVTKSPEDKDKPTEEVKTTDQEKEQDKENEKRESFKKISKNNRERNYRDKDRSKSRDKGNKGRDHNKEKRKRKELPRYDVRALIAEKPKKLTDKFGRDLRKSSSSSRSRSRSRSRSYGNRSPIRRSSTSRERKRKKKSPRRRSLSRSSRSLSRKRRRSLTPRPRRARSRSRSKRKKKQPSKDRSKKRKARARSSSRSRNRKGDDWDRRGYSPEGRWTPSLTPEMRTQSPSWTPPRLNDPRNLTVILQNDKGTKKKEKKKRAGKKKEQDKRAKRKKKEHTPLPSKEVFTSGDNILVSVSFNKENEGRERDVFTKKRKENEEKEKKKKTLSRRKKKNQELSTIKPVAIIDLARSPFRELTPSPRDIIVLSDDDQAEGGSAAAADPRNVCDSSQRLASPDGVGAATSMTTGPKTPPEPQVKFALPSKQLAIRPSLTNPLHDPTEEDLAEEEPELESADADVTRDSPPKGPNTPPDPPNSPPSSPDAYDPFEPTKSRSASPDIIESAPSADVPSVEDQQQLQQQTSSASEIVSISTPPPTDVQPDSQTGQQISRDSSKSPREQPLTPAIASTPLPGPPRINILNSTVLSNVSSTVPAQRIAPPIIKLSPVKNVAANASQNGAKPKSAKAQNGNNDSIEVISLDFDSPYSPGSSDYEDLFEPPPEVVTKKTLPKATAAAPAPKDLIPPAAQAKTKNTFDALFNAPVKKINTTDKTKAKKTKSGTKIVGVKLDEDHLKILDDLPNSAVEMQVKDKFLKKLNRQERVVEEVKLVLKPYYNKKKISKEEYKDIMRRSVPKICHNKSGEINPTRIKNLIEAYVKKMRHSKPKVTSSSSYNPLKG